MCAEETSRNTGDPLQWKLKLRSGRYPTDTLRREGKVATGVGEAHSSKEASKERGAKGPQFQGNATSGKGEESGESLEPQINLWKLQETLHEKESEKKCAFCCQDSPFKCKALKGN